MVTKAWRQEIQSIHYSRTEQVSEIKMTPAISLHNIDRNDI